MANELYAVVAESADALDSGSSLCKQVEVQVLSTAPYMIVKESTKAPLFCFCVFYGLLAGRTAV